jgi:hypothetical protein
MKEVENMCCRFLNSSGSFDRIHRPLHSMFQIITKIWMIFISFLAVPAVSIKYLCAGLSTANTTKPLEFSRLLIVASHLSLRIKILQWTAVPNDTTKKALFVQIAMNMDVSIPLIRSPHRNDDDIGK